MLNKGGTLLNNDPCHDRVFEIAFHWNLTHNYNSPFYRIVYTATAPTGETFEGYAIYDPNTGNGHTDVFEAHTYGNWTFEIQGIEKVPNITNKVMQYAGPDSKIHVSVTYCGDVNDSGSSIFRDLDLENSSDFMLDDNSESSDPDKSVMDDVDPQQSEYSISSSVTNKHGSLLDYDCFDKFPTIAVIWYLTDDFGENHRISYTATDPDGFEFYGTADYRSWEKSYFGMLDEDALIFPGTWTFKINSIWYSSNEEKRHFSMKYSGDDRIIYVTVPPCEIPPDDDPPKEDPPQEDPESDESVMDDLAPFSALGYAQVLSKTGVASDECVNPSENTTVVAKWTFSNPEYFEREDEVKATINIGLEGAPLSIPVEIDSSDIGEFTIERELDPGIWYLNLSSFLVLDDETEEYIEHPLDMEQTLITITIPECEIEPQIDIEIQDDVPPQEDNSPDSEQCTPDPFGYGEIVVVNNWGNYETLPENSGYILSWGWEIEYKQIETDDPILMSVLIQQME